MPLLTYNKDSPQPLGLLRNVQLPGPVVAVTRDGIVCLGSQKCFPDFGKAYLVLMNRSRTLYQSLYATKHI